MTVQNVGADAAVDLSVRNQSKPINVYICSSPKDDEFTTGLLTHLTLLQQRKLIQIWHESLIKPGEDRKLAATDQLNRAAIILVLISSDFLAETDTNSIDTILNRRSSGESVVIPVLVRAAYYSATAFEDLKPLPSSAQPISQWSNRDDAFLEIASSVADIASYCQAGDRAALVNANWIVSSRLSLQGLRRPAFRLVTASALCLLSGLTTIACLLFIQEKARILQIILSLVALVGALFCAIGVFLLRKACTHV